MRFALPARAAPSCTEVVVASPRSASAQCMRKSAKPWPIFDCANLQTVLQQNPVNLTDCLNDVAVCVAYSTRTIFVGGACELDAPGWLQVRFFILFSVFFCFQRG